MYVCVCNTSDSEEHYLKNLLCIPCLLNHNLYLYIPTKYLKQQTIDIQ